MSILNKVTAKLPGRGSDEEYFLALLITYRGVEAVLWTIAETKLKIIETGKADFKGAGNILETAAEAIDAACEPHDVDVKDVILGLPDSWISQNQILPQYFDKLNELAKNLDLTPFAFVALNHAVGNRLKVLYGTLVSGYLLNVDNENITLSSIVAGQLKETRFIKSNHGEFEASIQKLFAHFANSQYVEHNVYIYGSPIPPDAEQVLQRLTVFGGNVPMIKRLEDAFASHAIALAGAVDRGNLQGMHVEDAPEAMSTMVNTEPVGSAMPAVQSPVAPAAPQVMPGVVLPESDNLVTPTAHEQAQMQAEMPHESAQSPVAEHLSMPPTPVPHPVIPPNPGELPAGFHVVGNEPDQSAQMHQDAQQPNQSAVLEQYAAAGVPVTTNGPIIHGGEFAETAQHATPEHAVAEPAVHVEQPSPHVQAMEAGISEPVSAFPPAQNMPNFEQQYQPSIQHAEPIINDHMDHSGGRKLAIPLPISAITSLFPSIPLKVPKVPLGSGLGRVLAGKGIVLGVLVVIIVVAIVGYMATVKADVIITFTPKTVSGTKTILVSPKVSTADTATDTIPGTSQTVTVSGSTSGTATGKKQVGDKAKGSVVIYNKSSASKSLPAGTTLTSGNNSFALDQAVTVPAETVTDSTDTDGTPIEISKPGKVDTTATAGDIGTDYNVASGTSFTVKGQSSMTATATSAFSGGDSHDVTVVSDQDIKNAQNSIASSLKDQAKTQLMSKIGANQKVIDDSIKVSITKTTPSKNVGDQATSFTLTANATAQAMTYSTDDLNTIMQQVLSDQTTSGFTRVTGDQLPDPTYQNTDKNGVATLQWQYNVRLIPQTDNGTLATQIKGKSVASAKKALMASLQNVSDVQITLSPSFASVVNYLPFSASHITVQTVAGQ